MDTLSDRASFSKRLNTRLPFASRVPFPRVEGKLTRIVGLTLEAVGCHVVLGGRCKIYHQQDVLGASQESEQKELLKYVDAEVVGFSNDSVFLMPLGDIGGLEAGARVVPYGQSASYHIGDHLIGRVVDGQCRPLDGKPLKSVGDAISIVGKRINPLDREPINEPLDVGVKVINSLLTVGQGQRLGLFAGSGVGKSVLLGMMAKYTSADVTVVGLIGERGREVKEFIQEILGEDGICRSVVVASPADDSPLLRLQGAMLATTIAEYFRDQGKSVLLLMDSLTRFAQAQREIALAIGEPPATKGYPPSVFAKLPQLVERAGRGRKGEGSITAFYTVLTEGDDQQDPVADSARAILDGHIVLSRALAEEGHFPAVDIEASISRVMKQVLPADDLEFALGFRSIYARYQQNRDFISIGAYSQGADPEIDLAVTLMPSFNHFLCQGFDERVSFNDSVAGLKKLFSPANTVNMDQMQQAAPQGITQAIPQAIP